MSSTIQCSSCGHEVTRSDASASTCPACGKAISLSGAGVVARGSPSGSPARVTALKIWLSVLLLALAAYGGLTLWRIYADRNNKDDHPPMAFAEIDFPVGEFELTERSGEPFRSKDLLGQIWIASFFFGDCPGQCTILNHRIADLIVGELAQEPVKVVSISVDPKKDTPQRLTSYAEVYTKPRKMDPARWLFVTHAQGSEEVIGAICQSRFRVPFARAAHSEKLVLVDQQATVRGYYNPADPLDITRLKRKIQELQQNPPARRDDTGKDATGKDAA